MRGKRSTAASAGTPTASRRARGREQLGITDKSEIEAMGIARSTRRPRLRLEYTDEWEELRHPPGALGRLRARLQDPRRHLHGVRALGVQDAARQGPRLRGLPRAAVLLARRDAAVQPRAAHGRRRLQDAPGPTVTVTFPLTGAKAESLGLTAVRRSPGPPRPGRCRRTSRSRSVPTSATSCPAGRPARTSDPRPRAADAPSHGAATSSPRTSWPATPRTSATRRRRGAAARGRHHLAPHRRRAQGRHATTALRLLRATPRSRAPRTPGASSSPTTSPPPTAPASCTRPPPTARTTRRSARPPASP